MSTKPTLFISSVSRELGSARQLVANPLSFLGYDADWQDVFETEQGDLRQMLRQKIDRSRGVIHLVGHRYGAEPKVVDEEFGRVSYTQFEALYARKQGKPVWTFLVEEGFPADAAEPEPAELATLQAAYRERVRDGGDLYYPARSLDGLEASTLKLRGELVQLRRQFRRWAVGSTVLLLLIAGLTVWLVVGQGRDAEAIRQTQQTSEQTAEVALDTQKTTRQTHEAVRGTQSAVEETRQSALNTEAVARQTDQTVRETAESTRQTTAVVEQTGREVRQTREVVGRMDSRETRDSASARVQEAVEAMNRSNRGQVEALELLLANDYTWESSKFDGVALRDADLRGGMFRSSSFKDADLRGVNWTGADLRQATGFFADAAGLVAADAEAAEFRLQMADAPGAVFDGATLTQGSFYFSNLRGASFRGADCTAVNFAYADLSDADFTGATLTGAQFIGAVLAGAKFDGAHFEATDMSGALIDVDRFTPDQRREFRRTTSFKQHMLIFQLVRVRESDRFSSGKEFDDRWRIEFLGLPGRVPGSLRVRREDTPEPSGFTAAWRWENSGTWRAADPRRRLNIEADFLNVGDRERRLRDRLQALGDSLLEQTQRLTPVEGDGSEFADWLADLERRKADTRRRGPLRLTDANQLMLSLHLGTLAEADIDPYRWNQLSSYRFAREAEAVKQARDAPGDALPASLDGWPLFFQPFDHDITEAPHAMVRLYHDWFFARVAALTDPEIVFEVTVRRPRYGRSVKVRPAGPMPVFDELAQTLREYSRWSEPVELQPAAQVFPFDRYMGRLPSARDQWVLPVDAELTYPLKVRVVAKVSGLTHPPVAGRDNQTHTLYDLQPIHAHITDQQGATWSGEW